ncbi:hypothetical protein ACOSQ3_011224 [Xanthoceras sorbifolium]
MTELSFPPDSFALFLSIAVWPKISHLIGFSLSSRRFLSNHRDFSGFTLLVGFSIPYRSISLCDLLFVFDARRISLLRVGYFSLPRFLSFLSFSLYFSSSLLFPHADSTRTVPFQPPSPKQPD